MGVVCVLGAGFSHVAGLPLAADLLRSQVLVPSEGASRRHQSVWQDYGAFDANAPPADVYLRRIYEMRMTSGGWIRWRNAVELIAAVLATPRRVDRVLANPRYLGRLTFPVRDPTHADFWSCILSRHDLQAVVTTNYDLLAERGLRHRPTKRPGRPGFYYGGIERPQLLVGTALPFTIHNPQRVVELEGQVPIYKLHGSLNWAESGGRLTMYQDARAAFRDGGTAGIVPPVPQATIPKWLTGVWRDAQAALAQAATWIVVGYSLPEYDIDVRELISRASAGRRIKIVICDPFSTELAHRWRELVRDAETTALPGLPDALRLLAEVADS